METFCLVHGAWHDDACWEPLVAELTRRGHECVTPVLPLEDPDAHFEDYARVVTEHLRIGYVRPPVDGEDRSWWPRERALAELYGRLDRGLAKRLADRLRPQPQSVFRAPYPLTRPPALPSAFLYTRDDEIFDDHWSRWIARTLVGVEPIELPGGHFPTLEHTDRLADALARAGSY